MKTFQNKLTVPGSQIGSALGILLIFTLVNLIFSRAESGNFEDLRTRASSNQMVSVIHPG